MRCARRPVSVAPAHGWATRRWNEARLSLSTLACARARGPSRPKHRQCGTAKRYQFAAPLPQEQLVWLATSSPAQSLASWTKARGGRPRFQSGIQRCAAPDQEREPGSRNRSKRWSGDAFCFFLPRLWRIADRDQQPARAEFFSSTALVSCLRNKLKPAKRGLNAP